MVSWACNPMNIQKVSDLSSVLWFHGLHGNHCGSACVEFSCTCSCFVYSHVRSSVKPQIMNNTTNVTDLRKGRIHSTIV